MGSTAKASPPRRAALRRIGVRAGMVLGALALLWTAGFLVVPPIVRSQAEQAVEQLLGRKLTLGQVRFNPWTLVLTIENAAIAGPVAGAPPSLELRRVYVDAAITTLLRRAPVVDHLQIDGPMLRVTRRDAGLDIDDVLKRIADFMARPSTEPARFALHNIRVTDGAVDFVDEPAKVTHRLRALALDVPFLSSLPSERTIEVEPRLAFTLDGSRFESTGNATPFAETRRGESRIRLDGFDIAPWLSYLPRDLPARPRAARIGTDLTLAWEQKPRLSLRIAGNLRLDGIEIVDAASHRLLDAGTIRLAIDDLRPFESTARLARLDIDAPRVLAERDARGRLNLLLESPEGSRAAAPAPAPAVKSAVSPSSGWRVALAAFSLRAGRLDWRDATTAPPTALALADVALEAKTLGWPLDAPIVFQGEGRLDGAPDAGRLSFSGQGNAGSGHVDVKAEHLPLDAAQGYAGSVLALPLAGQLDADVGVDWHDEHGATALAVEARELAIGAFRLGPQAAPDLAIDRLGVERAHVDTATRRASVARVTLSGPRLRIDRGPEGTLNVTRWTRTASPPAPTSEAARLHAASARTGAASDAWSWAVDELAIDHGRIGYTDHTTSPRPFAVELSELGARVQRWALDSKTPTSFRIGARVQAAAAPGAHPPPRARTRGAGSLEASGEFGPSTGGVPRAARAKVAIRDLPLHAAQPYLAPLVDIDLKRALGSFRGDVSWNHRPDGEALRVRGDASLDDVHAASTPQGVAAAARPGDALPEPSSNAPLFDWKSLSVRGIDVALAPGTVTRVVMGETTLDDFSARLVLDENGRLNLQDVTPRAAAGAASAPVSSAAASAPANTSAPTAASPTSPAPLIDVGPIIVTNGRIDYRDLFVRPNYRTDLSEVNGRLSKFSSRPAAPGAPPALADLDLRARAEGTAPVAINGRLNPLIRPLALDLKATVHDLDLPPLSTYSVKYAGHGITHGKLSADVAYTVTPDGRLRATNRIVLNQLTFGEKDPAAKRSLPVKLAVALLADRNGVIDVNLPIGGSINDPEFSIGGLIWKAIGNLLAKVVTAPFTLLASAFGGGDAERPSHVDFAPGSPVLDVAARERLDNAAKALVERPALQITVVGEARLAVEGDAFRKQRLQQMLLAEKRRQASAAGTPSDGEITVSDTEAPALLKAVYQSSSIKKPRNVIGLAKDLPPPEMEALLLASMRVDDETMAQLAQARAVAVRDYLIAHELPSERLFLGTAKPPGPDEKGWTPRASIELSAK
ncbi:MAG TPA: DUF748 domain-containing protein [Caldimonas sp.]|nr:DUF748 domain-containing protein [Caldimonas sp.]